MKNLKTWLLPIVLLGVTLALLATMLIPKNTDNPYSRSIGGEFELNSINGPVRLSDFKGQAVMLFFGYTSCPDVCPTNMATMRQVLDNLPDAQKEQVVGLFVSVDPERDSLKHIQDYAQFFHKRLYGITGTLEEVTAVTKQYGAVFKKEDSDSALGYLVQHTASTYLIGPDGKIVDLIDHNESYKTIISRIQEII